MHRSRCCFLLVVFTVGCVAMLSAQSTILGPLNNVSTVASTIPSNGDVNPYGVFQVPTTSGKLTAGHILVSNFNNSGNMQGTGTTIMDIAPTGAVTQFAQIDPNKLPGPCPGGVGLTTALVVLRTGWVIVGSLPTKDGTSATARAGCLLVLNNQGQVVETFSGGKINGPWDMTVFDAGTVSALFVTNVLTHSASTVHTGTVVRLVVSSSRISKPKMISSTTIGSGFPNRTDPAALVIGPTGVALSPSLQTLYVADTLGNRIAAIPNAIFRGSSAGTGSTVTKNRFLNGPLGLSRAPNGHLIAANSNDGNLVEIVPWEKAQVAKKLVDNTGMPAGAGTLFGLVAFNSSVYFVDDGSNTLNLLH